MINNTLAVAGVVIKELYRRKDFYVLFVLTALITLVLGSVHFFNDDKIARYLKEICLLLIWISSIVISVTMSARQIPAERENRTIFPLLAKPISRGDVVLGKFVGCWLSSGLVLVVFYSFFFFISGLREHNWPIINVVQAVWLHWMALGIICGLVLLGSVVFAAPSSNATISLVCIIGILFLGRHLHKVAMQLKSAAGLVLTAIYFAIPHLEFYDIREMIVHNVGIIPWTACFLVTLYALVYMSIFLFSTWLVFRKQTLTR